MIAGSVFTNAFGEWSLVLSALDAQQTLSARACSNDRCGELSETIQIIYNGSPSGADRVGIPGECRIEAFLEKYRFNNHPRGKGIDLQLRTEGTDARKKITIDWGDTSVDHYTLDDQEIKLHNAYEFAGRYNGTAAVEINEDCRDTVYFSVHVIEVQESDRVFQITMATSLAVFGYATYTYFIRPRYVKQK